MSATLAVVRLLSWAMRSAVPTIAAALFSLFTLSLFADVTYYVSKSGDGSDPTSGDYTKAYSHPQLAVNAADGTTPTTIKIATGTYTYKTAAQNVAVLNVNKNNVTIEALDGEGTVTIDGGTADGSGTFNRRALTVPSTAENVLVRYLVFKNGRASTSNGTTGTSVSGGVLEYCDISGYQANKTAAVTISGTATLRNCSLTMAASMQLNGSQAHTLLEIAGSAVLEDCTIRDIGYKIATLGKFHRPVSLRRRRYATRSLSATRSQRAVSRRRTTCTALRQPRSSRTMFTERGLCRQRPSPVSRSMIRSFRRARSSQARGRC